MPTWDGINTPTCRIGLQSRQLMKEQALALHASLRADLPADAIAELRTAVRDHYDALVRAQEHAELVPVDLAELLCVRLEVLLDVYDAFPPARRADLVGAARYFVSEDDAVPDSHALTGLDDDVYVFNTVVRALGRADLVIDG